MLTLLTPTANAAFVLRNQPTRTERSLAGGLFWHGLRTAARSDVEDNHRGCTVVHHPVIRKHCQTMTTTNTNMMTRRDATRAAWLTAWTTLTATTGLTTIYPDAAWASGGATAGRYTTIPIAKRRYYGRVQEGVHEFLLMGPSVVKGDMSVPIIQTFFDEQGAVIVPAKTSTAIGGQCTKKDNDCRGKEIRDSRYNDMKASMYLLGNAFRTDQQKPPDRLPTVKAAKAFFKEMDEMQKIVTKKAGANLSPAQSEAAQQRYLAALDILDQYLDLVELPPTDSGHYDQEFDTLVGETARIT